MIRYDENGNPQAIASTKQRAEELFEVGGSANLFCGKSKTFSILGNIKCDWINTGHCLILQAIDKDSDGALTLEEFIDAYNRRTEILKRQVNVFCCLFAAKGDFLLFICWKGWLSVYLTNRILLSDVIFLASIMRDKMQPSCLIFGIFGQIFGWIWPLLHFLSVPTKWSKGKEDWFFFENLNHQLTRRLFL